VFVVGPLAILGPLSDGSGRGIDQLALKSTLDGFAALAFAASFGWGVAASALSVGVVQGLLTLLGALLGGLLPEALVSSVTATGGVLLLGVGLRLLHVKAVAGRRHAARARGGARPDSAGPRAALTHRSCCVTPCCTQTAP
jgi:uncharacterized membrane protein YqgA involved in biofilm formation